MNNSNDLTCHDNVSLQKPDLRTLTTLYVHDLPPALLISILHFGSFVYVCDKQHTKRQFNFYFISKFGMKGNDVSIN